MRGWSKAREMSPQLGNPSSVSDGAVYRYRCQWCTEVGEEEKWAKCSFYPHIKIFSIILNNNNILRLLINCMCINYAYNKSQRVRFNFI
jgi:hypothetical protein